MSVRDPESRPAVSLSPTNTLDEDPRVGVKQNGTVSYQISG